MKGFYTILLLIVSNVFMTFAWYGHLKMKQEYSWFAALPLIGVIAFSWATHTTKQQTKKKFIVSREFSGNQSMKEAFEQLIERQTHSQFEEWLERKAG